MPSRAMKLASDGCTVVPDLLTVNLLTHIALDKKLTKLLNHNNIFDLVLMLAERVTSEDV
jgi:hypothetical protein